MPKPAQDKISLLEFPGADPLVVVAPHALLISGGAHGCPASDLLEEVDIVDPPFVMSIFVVEEDPG